MPGTDNKHVRAKLELRRRLLRKAAWTDHVVLDAFAGEGRLWTQLRQEFPVSQYLPIDMKPRQAGSLQGDAVRIIQSVGIGQFNVIDIDSYGEPWSVFYSALMLIEQPTAFFLTHGLGRGFAGLSKPVRRALQIPESWKLPVHVRFTEWASQYCLNRAANYATINTAFRFVGQRVTYYGLLVTPTTSPATPVGEG